MVYYKRFSNLPKLLNKTTIFTILQHNDIPLLIFSFVYMP